MCVLNLQKEVITLAHKVMPAVARNNRGLSREEVARKSGLSLSWICQIESGHKQHNIQQDAAYKYASALGYTVKEIEWSKDLSQYGRPPLTGGKYCQETTSLDEVLCNECSILQAPINGSCSCCGC